MADPIDTDAIRTAVWGGDARLIRRLCDEVDRLRAENAALAAALGDIAGMDTLGARRWFATAECASFDPRRCHEHMGQPDGGPDEWCPVCVAEICWCAWKMGVLA